MDCLEVGEAVKQACTTIGTMVQNPEYLAMARIITLTLVSMAAAVIIIVTVKSQRRKKITRIHILRSKSKTPPAQELTTIVRE